jgi:hypothetical protein
MLPDTAEATWPGMGICRTLGVPARLEGTGEFSRAVEATRGAEVPKERPLFEPGDDDIGTGRGRGLDPPRNDDMITVYC